MDSFFNILRKKWWLFILFILPSTIIVYFTNNLLYPLIMNSENLFKITSYVSLIVITLFLVFIYLVIESRIPSARLKKIFKILIIIISIFFIFISLMNIAVSGLFKYESCGEEFNNIYIQSAKEKDYSFCFDTDYIELNYCSGLKGYISYCKTPNRDSIQIFGIGDNLPDDRITSCISSFSDYTHDVTICQSLKILNDNLSEEDKVRLLDSKVSECIHNYATRNQEWQVCDLILKTDYPSKQSKWETCIKIVSLRTKDKSLCEKIPSSSRFKNACLKG